MEVGLKKQSHRHKMKAAGGSFPAEVHALLCSPNKASKRAVSVQASSTSSPSGRRTWVRIWRSYPRLDLPCPAQPRIFFPSSALSVRPSFFHLLSNSLTAVLEKSQLRNIKLFFNELYFWLHGSFPQTGYTTVNIWEEINTSQ